MASTVFADEAVRLRDDAGLTDAMIARATGAAPSTVRDWLAGRSAPTGVRAEHIGELAAVVDRLARVMDVGYVPVWLIRPVEALDDHKPVDLITRGQYRRVLKLIAGLEDQGAA
jgi:transcriptional regulator with XRE-family HTH domain